MSKFKIKMKLQGLELEIEGSREDIPSIAQNLGEQLTGLIQPAAAIVGGNTTTVSSGPTPLTIDNSASDLSNNKKQRRRKRPTVEQTNVESITIEWRHDPSKYGSPRQDWNPTNKSIWLLYVISQETQTNQLSASQITSIFNRKFKQAGLLRGSNVSRDLGSSKSRSPAPVGEDTTKQPGEWFLTDSGIRKAQELIQEFLNGSQ